jgi:thiamine biosynthesis protein ThiC
LMSIARHNLDWKEQQKYAIDKCVFYDIDKGNPCTMCGEYCSMKIYKKYF